jgi:hypothetical protein
MSRDWPHPSASHSVAGHVGDGLVLRVRGCQWQFFLLATNTRENSTKVALSTPAFPELDLEIRVPSRPLRATVALPTPLGKEMVPVFSPD